MPLKQPEESWVEFGVQVWNGTIMVLACIFIVEATIFFWMGMQAPDMQFASPTNGTSWNTTLTTVSQGKLEVGLGIALYIAAASMIGLAVSQCMACCFEKSFMKVVYTLFCVLLIGYELLFIYVIVAIEHWDVFKEEINGVTITKTSKSLEDCMWLLVPELVISMFMQIGGMVFHLAWRQQLRMRDGMEANSFCCGLCGDEEPQPGARYRKLFKTFSGGESNVVLEENHILRLESMREYYAQLYVENGLDVPTELADDDVMRRRVAKKANANK